jgi:hypothetical protein
MVGRVRSGVRLGLREAAFLLAANDRHQIVFAGLALERVEDRADRRAENLDIARRQRRGPRNFAPHDHLGQHAEPGPAELLGHVEQPQAQRLDLVAQAVGQSLLQLDVVDHLALERDQFAVDKAADILLQQPKLFGKLEIHCVAPF